MSSWISVKKETEIPACPGCYVFIKNKRTVLYVGSAVNLISRIRNHLNNAAVDENHWLFGGGARIKIKVSRRYGDWLMDELRLIRRLQPRHNKKGKEISGPPKYTLRRRPRIFSTDPMPSSSEVIYPEEYTWPS